MPTRKLEENSQNDELHQTHKLNELQFILFPQQNRFTTRVCSKIKIAA
jgi:hypothetical protein